MSSTIKEKFSAQLRAALKAKYGMLPSASHFAVVFNRQIAPDEVSGESARRWMRGVTLPSYHHMEALVQWLNLNLDTVMRSKTPASVERSSGSNDDLLSSLRPDVGGSIPGLIAAAPSQVHKLGKQGSNWA